MTYENRNFSALTAFCIIVANMVGTGVFTSLGFQLFDLQTGFPLIMLWVIGGLAALCGAMCYAELGAALPRSGGEYNFLSHIYHPGVGFVGGWISALIGFSAPIALAAMTFSAYFRSAFLSPDLVWIDRYLAAALVIGLGLLHAGRRRAGGQLQIAFTLLKIGVILGFCFAAIFSSPALQPIQFLPTSGDGGAMTSAAFAVSLIYVSYAYTGWNSATYISNELANPQRDLPRILVSGTLLVMALYIALNAVFLLVAPIDLMVGKVEVGVIAARAAFGEIGAKLAGLVLATLLISTISAMTIAGPRVLQMIGEDIPNFKTLAQTNIDGVPSRAIYLQTAISVFFVLTSSFESVLVFSGFTLAFMSFLTVGGLFVLRWREPDLERPYRASFYPLPGLIYLVLTGWTLGFVLRDKPVEALLSVAFMMTGAIVYITIRCFGEDADATTR